MMGNVCVTCPPPGFPRLMPTRVWRDVRFGFVFFFKELAWEAEAGQHTGALARHVCKNSCIAISPGRIRPLEMCGNLSYLTTVAQIPTQRHASFPVVELHVQPHARCDRGVPLHVRPGSRLECGMRIDPTSSVHHDSALHQAWRWCMQPDRRGPPYQAVPPGRHGAHPPGYSTPAGGVLARVLRERGVRGATWRWLSSARGPPSRVRPVAQAATSAPCRHPSQRGCAGPLPWQGPAAGLCHGALRCHALACFPAVVPPPHVAIIMIMVRAMETPEVPVHMSALALGVMCSREPADKVNLASTMRRGVRGGKSNISCYNARC